MNLNSSQKQVVKWAEDVISESLGSVWASELSDVFADDSDLFYGWCSATCDLDDETLILPSINKFFESIGLKYKVIQIDQEYEDVTLLLEEIL